jgi:hypothetical protein
MRNIAKFGEGKVYELRRKMENKTNPSTKRIVEFYASLGRVGKVERC